MDIAEKGPKYWADPISHADFQAPKGKFRMVELEAAGIFEGRYFWRGDFDKAEDALSSKKSFQKCSSDHFRIFDDRGKEVG